MRFGNFPGPARRNPRSSGEDKRRGYKPLLPVLAKVYAKFGQSSKNKQESGNGQGRSWQGVWKGRKERRMAMERSLAGVGQELGRAGPVFGTPRLGKPRAADGSAHAAGPIYGNSSVGWFVITFYQNFCIFDVFLLDSEAWTPLGRPFWHHFGAWGPLW